MLLSVHAVWIQQLPTQVVVTSVEIVEDLVFRRITYGHFDRPTHKVDALEQKSPDPGGLSADTVCSHRLVTRRHKSDVIRAKTNFSLPVAQHVDRAPS